jgi:hypothetical protein
VLAVVDRFVHHQVALAQPEPPADAIVDELGELLGLAAHEPGLLLGFFHDVAIRKLQYQRRWPGRSAVPIAAVQPGQRGAGQAAAVAAERLDDDRVQGVGPGGSGAVALEERQVDFARVARQHGHARQHRLRLSETYARERPRPLALASSAVQLYIWRLEAGGSWRQLQLW